MSVRLKLAHSRTRRVVHTQCHPLARAVQLEDFPCDVQNLGMSICFNVRTTGMMPLKIVLARDFKANVLSSAIEREAKIWNIHHQLDVVPKLVGASEDRLFPTVDMIIVVGRYPTFVLLNVGFPCFFFVPLTMLQFAVPRGNVGDRVSVAFAIVLTTIAHKFTMVNMVPDVSCMTLLHDLLTWAYRIPGLLVISMCLGLLAHATSMA